MVLRDLAPDMFRFGHFTLEPQRRLLSLDGNAIPLSSRAFDILLLLVEQRDRVVTKDEIFARVWPGTIVEENNLAVQISALRRALGEQPGDHKLIMTVPGRGYRFVGSLELEPALPAAAPPQPSPEPQGLHPAASAQRGMRHPAWIAGVAACIVILAIVGARTAFHGTYTAPRLSIAVLPFRNLSGDPQQDYLADAISDDLTTDLSHIPGSVVIARESADTYKGRAVPAQDIGRALNVRYLLEGSVRIEAETFHINAQLIDAATGTHLWADLFNVTRDKVGAAQEQIVRRIASALNITLMNVEALRSQQKRPDNQDSVDYFFQARSILDKSHALNSLLAAQKFLGKAVEKADFAEAHAELGLVLLKKISDFDDDDEARRDYAQARSAIMTALAQNPLSPVAVTADGMLFWVDFKCDQALPRFAEALRLDPNEVRAMEGFALCSRELGQMQSMIDHLQHILLVDPLNAGNAHRRQLIGLGYLLLGRPAEANDWLNRAAAGAGSNRDTESVPLDPAEWQALYTIATAEMLKQTDRAATLYAAYKRQHPNRTTWLLSAYATHAMCQLPGFKAFLAALQSAGMPAYADEAEDFGVKPQSGPRPGDDLDPTPTRLSGGRVINAKTLHAMLQQTPSPIVLDVGRGTFVPKGARWVWSQSIWVDRASAVEQLLSDAHATTASAIVMMGDNLLGWDSYNAAQVLISHGYRNVLWYRGGEETWAMYGYDGSDMRRM